MDNNDFERLGGQLNLDELAKRLTSNASNQSPTKMIQFAKEWIKIEEEPNPSVDVALNFSFTGDKAREVRKALALHKFLKARGEMDLSQMEFLEHLFVVGAAAHNTLGDTLKMQAEAMQTFIKQLRDNPEEFHKGLDEFIKHGEDEFLDE
jgi:hypothetical protein